MIPKVKANRGYILKTARNKVLKDVQESILKTAKREVVRSNRELLKRFLQDEITKEIAAGPMSENTSGTLGGKGNLFSFLGFQEGSDQISELAEFLTNSIKIERISISKTNFSVRVSISVPTIEDIEGFTELPWISKSWVKAIEEGMSGLAQFLFSEEGFKTSRSSTGIQAVKSVSGASMQSQNYLTDIIKVVSKQLISKIKSGV